MLHVSMSSHDSFTTLWTSNCNYLVKKCVCWGGDFPGGLVIKNLPANGGHPWSGEIPGAKVQLRLCFTTTEPVLETPCSATKDAATVRGLLTATEISCSQK